MDYQSREYKPVRASNGTFKLTEEPVVDHEAHIREKEYSRCVKAFNYWKGCYYADGGAKLTDEIFKFSQGKGNFGNFTGAGAILARWLTEAYEDLTIIAIKHLRSLGIKDPGKVRMIMDQYQADMRMIDYMGEQARKSSESSIAIRTPVVAPPCHNSTKVRSTVFLYSQNMCRSVKINGKDRMITFPFRNQSDPLVNAIPITCYCLREHKGGHLDQASGIYEMEKVRIIAHGNATYGSGELHDLTDKYPNENGMDSVGAWRIPVYTALPSGTTNVSYIYVALYGVSRGLLAKAWNLVVNNLPGPRTSVEAAYVNDFEMELNTPIIDVRLPEKPMKVKILSPKRWETRLQGLIAELTVYYNRESLFDGAYLSVHEFRGLPRVATVPYLERKQNDKDLDIFRPGKFAIEVKSATTLDRAWQKLEGAMLQATSDLIVPLYYALVFPNGILTVKSQSVRKWEVSSAVKKIRNLEKPEAPFEWHDMPTGLKTKFEDPIPGQDQDLPMTKAEISMQRLVDLAKQSVEDEIDDATAPKVRLKDLVRCKIKNENFRFPTSFGQPEKQLAIKAKGPFAKSVLARTLGATMAAWDKPGVKPSAPLDAVSSLFMFGYNRRCIGVVRPNRNMMPSQLATMIKRNYPAEVSDPFQHAKNILNGNTFDPVRSEDDLVFASGTKSGYLTINVKADGTVHRALKVSNEIFRHKKVDDSGPVTVDVNYMTMVGTLMDEKVNTNFTANGFDLKRELKQGLKWDEEAADLTASAFKKQCYHGNKDLLTLRRILMGVATPNRLPKGDHAQVNYREGVVTVVYVMTEIHIMMAYVSDATANHLKYILPSTSMMVPTKYRHNGKWKTGTIVYTKSSWSLRELQEMLISVSFKTVVSFMRKDIHHKSHRGKMSQRIIKAFEATTWASHDAKIYKKTAIEDDPEVLASEGIGAACLMVAMRVCEHSQHGKGAYHHSFNGGTSAKTSLTKEPLAGKPGAMGTKKSLNKALDRVKKGLACGLDKGTITSGGTTLPSCIFTTRGTAEHVRITRETLAKHPYLIEFDEGTETYKTTVPKATLGCPFVSNVGGRSDDVDLNAYKAGDVIEKVKNISDFGTWSLKPVVVAADYDMVSPQKELELLRIQMEFARRNYHETDNYAAYQSPVTSLGLTIKSTGIVETENARRFLELDRFIGTDVEVKDGFKPLASMLMMGSNNSVSTESVMSQINNLTSTEVMRLGMINGMRQMSVILQERTGLCLSEYVPLYVVSPFSAETPKIGEGGEFFRKIQMANASTKKAAAIGAGSPLTLGRTPASTLLSMPSNMQGVTSFCEQFNKMNEGFVGVGKKYKTDEMIMFNEKKHLITIGPKTSSRPYMDVVRSAIKARYNGRPVDDPRRFVDLYLGRSRKGQVIFKAEKFKGSIKVVIPLYWLGTRLTMTGSDESSYGPLACSVTMALSLLADNPDYVEGMATLIATIASTTGPEVRVLAKPLVKKAAEQIRSEISRAAATIGVMELENPELSDEDRIMIYRKMCPFTKDFVAEQSTCQVMIQELLKMGSKAVFSQKGDGPQGINNAIGSKSVDRNFQEFIAAFSSAGASTIQLRMRETGPVFTEGSPSQSLNSADDKLLITFESLCMLNGASLRSKNPGKVTEAPCIVGNYVTINDEGDAMFAYPMIGLTEKAGTDLNGAGLDLTHHMAKRLFVNGKFSPCIGGRYITAALRAAARAIESLGPSKGLGNVSGLAVELQPRVLDHHVGVLEILPEVSGNGYGHYAPPSATARLDRMMGNSKGNWSSEREKSELLHNEREEMRRHYTTRVGSDRVPNSTTPEYDRAVINGSNVPVVRRVNLTELASGLVSSKLTTGVWGEFYPSMTTARRVMRSGEVRITKDRVSALASTLARKLFELINGRFTANLTSRITPPPREERLQMVADFETMVGQPVDVFLQRIATSKEFTIGPGMLIYDVPFALQRTNVPRARYVVDNAIIAPPVLTRSRLKGKWSIGNSDEATAQLRLKASGSVGTASGDNPMTATFMRLRMEKGKRYKLRDLAGVGFNGVLCLKDENETHDQLLMRHIMDQNLMMKTVDESEYVTEMKKRLGYYRNLAARFSPDQGYKRYYVKGPDDPTTGDWRNGPPRGGSQGDDFTISVENLVRGRRTYQDDNINILEELLLYANNPHEPRFRDILGLMSLILAIITLLEAKQDNISGYVNSFPGDDSILKNNRMLPKGWSPYVTKYKDELYKGITCKAYASVKQGVTIHTIITVPKGSEVSGKKGVMAWRDAARKSLGNWARLAALYIKISPHLLSWDMVGSMVTYVITRSWDRGGFGSEPLMVKGQTPVAIDGSCEIYQSKNGNRMRLMDKGDYNFEKGLNNEGSVAMVPIETEFEYQKGWNPVVMFRVVKGGPPVFNAGCISITSEWYSNYRVLPSALSVTERTPTSPYVHELDTLELVHKQRNNLEVLIGAREWNWPIEYSTWETGRRERLALDYHKFFTKRPTENESWVMDRHFTEHG